MALDDYRKNIVEIVDRAERAGVKVMILTSTPIGEEVNDNNRKLAAYNDFLRELARERNLPLADLAEDFRVYLDKRPTDRRSRHLTVDGVHMNPEGNVLMAKGCLRAFGLSGDEADAVEAAWLDQPKSASLGVYPYDPRNNFGVTLGEYRALAQKATTMETTTVELLRTLWLRELAAAVGRYADAKLLDPERIKKEANDALQRRVGEMLE